MGLYYYPGSTSCPLLALASLACLYFGRSRDRNNGLEGWLTTAWLVLHGASPLVSTTTHELADTPPLEQPLSSTYILVVPRINKLSISSL